MRDDFFHHGFATALGASTPDPAAPAWTRQPGFAVYRNTWRQACVDALLDHYPALRRLAGDDWLQGAAAAFAEAFPPREPALLAYGAGLADWVAGPAAAAGVPYLADVARLERCWTEAHAGADAIALPADALAGLDPAALGGLRLRPHPATRWAWCAEHPAFTLWSRSRARQDEAAPVDWQAEGALFTRPGDQVLATALPLAGCRLLDRCAAGATLGEAAEAALAADPGADLPATVATLLASGAFLHLPTKEPS